METTHIHHLPSSILSMVASILPFKDILHFRLTCTAFYEATLCKPVLKTFKVQGNAAKKLFFKFMENIYGGKFVNLTLTSLKDDQLKKILQCVPNVDNLTIKMQHLAFLKETCKNLKSLSLYDKDVDFFRKMDQSSYNDYFQSKLSNLELKELSIFGCSQVYYASLIKAILQALTTVDTITFVSISINNSKEIVEFREFLRSCKQIVRWSLHNVHFTSKKRLTLPLNISTYECIDSTLSLVDKRHTCLKKLVLHGMIPYVDKIWKQNAFVDLAHLELRGCFFYHSKLLKCKKLRVLKLLNCHLPYSYLMNLSSLVKESLTVLHIESRRDFDNEKILKVINIFSNLRELILIGCNEITPMFLYAVKHGYLKYVYLNNCRNFRSAKSKDEIISMKEYLTFTVHLEDCDSCSYNAFS